MTKKARRKAAQSEPPSLQLHFLGANKTVTGSLHLLEYKNKGETLRFFVDMGLNQERESANFQNRLPKGVKASDLAFGIFTHAHIDHVGFFPKLVKDGFAGVVYATQASCDLLEILLPDSGFIQEQDAKRRSERARKQSLQRAESGQPSSQDQSFKPLYSEADAKASLALLQARDFHKSFSPAPGVTVRFMRASHLLGAAIVVLEIGEGSNKRRIVFSGDLGRKGMPIIQDMDFPRKADYVICEGTYGARLHERRNRLATLAGIINEAYKRAENKSKKGCGIILMPAFAVGRVQSVLFDLRQLMSEKRIPQIPVFVDSPMANKATAVYRKHKSLYNNKAVKAGEQGDIFSPTRYAELNSLEESLYLDQSASEPVIVLSSSGMANGGRVTRHLQNRLSDSNSTVVFVGFQSEGTLGRHLLEGPAMARIGGKSIKVKASIEQMPDYSGHGDYEDILKWLSSFEPRPKKLFLVHGDEPSLEALKSKVQDSLNWHEPEIPEYRTMVQLL